MICVSLDTNDSILLKSKDKSFHALFYIIRQIPFDTNVWYSDRINKDAICDELSMSGPALEKMLSSLKERDLLVKVSRGKYKLSELLLEDY